MFVYKVNCEEFSAANIGESRGTLVKKQDEKSQTYKHNIENRGDRFEFDAVQILAMEKLESSEKFIEGVKAKITSIAIKRGVNMSGCHFGVSGIGQRRS